MPITRSNVTALSLTFVGVEVVVVVDMFTKRSVDDRSSEVSLVLMTIFGEMAFLLRKADSVTTFRRV